MRHCGVEEDLIREKCKKKIVERTESYPYFTQVWENCLAERLDQTRARVITMETVKEVETAAVNERNNPSLMPIEP